MCFMPTHACINGIFLSKPFYLVVIERIRQEGGCCILMPVNAFRLSGRALFDDELIRRGLQPQAAKLLIFRPADASMLRILCKMQK